MKTTTLIKSYLWVLFLLWLNLVFNNSCKKDKTPVAVSGGHFAFGTAYNECAGNCARFFKIENGKLFPDNMNYYTDTLLFISAPMDNQKYLAAKPLLDNFPEYLNNNPVSEYC